jgi:hypothetical protein
MLGVTSWPTKSSDGVDVLIKQPLDHQIQVAPFGTWQSEITASAVTYGSTGFAGVRVCVSKVLDE